MRARVLCFVFRHLVMIWGIVVVGTVYSVTNALSTAIWGFVIGVSLKLIGETFFSR